MNFYRRQLLKLNTNGSGSMINNEWDLVKWKSFYKAKDKVNTTKQEPIDWEKIFTNPTFKRELISKMYKEFKKLDTNKPTNPILKWGTELNREFSTEESQMDKKQRSI